MKKTKFTTMIESEILLKIKIEALKEGRSVSEILNDLIKKYLEEKGEG